VSAATLAPLSWIYAAAVRARNRRYDRPGVARRAALPVISVGNLTVGGTGQTPTVAWLAERLVARGSRPAIVSRGYGGRAGRGPVVVSTGAGPLCPPEISGDEPALLSRIVRGASIVVGADRAAGAERAHTLGASVVLLDDGFQHRALARDLDVVLLDAARPFGNGRLLPAGELREPIDSLARADVVVLTRAGSVDTTEARQAVAAHRPGIPLLRSSFRRLGFVDAGGAAVAAPERAVAFCGIARPDSFRAELAAEPTEIVSFRAFADHHRFTARELAELRDAARRARARLVTTQKDLARLGSHARADDAPIALAIALALDDPETLLDAVERAIVRRAA
jgi:tetraacyldisaccharide 4'-kinase